MTIQDAIKMLNSKISGKKVIGYWLVENGIVLNVEPRKNIPEPAQFMVTNDGNVYATNPMNTDFDRYQYVRIS